MIKLTLIFILLSIVACFAAIESIYIKGIQFGEDGDFYIVTCYSKTDPWIILCEKTVPKSEVNFLKGCTPPIWITFKNETEIGSILSGSKRMKGSNLKEEEKQKILKFREYLE